MAGWTLGVIGGSGLYEIEGLEDRRWVRIESPFGEPSDELLTGRIGAVRLVFLPRHGRGHRLPPTWTPARPCLSRNTPTARALSAAALLSVRLFRRCKGAHRIALGDDERPTHTPVGARDLDHRLNQQRCGRVGLRVGHRFGN